ncbi:acetyltransferase [Pirellulales bacterium]|nr:acetyltransferase [Pirellulales bacterium]
MPPTRWIIVGAGAFGRETYHWTRDMISGCNDQSMGGFLDANAHALQGFDIGVPVLGDPNNYVPSSGDRLVCAIAEPRTKLEVCRSMQRRGGTFGNVIHPTAIVASDAELGEGVILCPRALISTNVSVGNFVTVNVASSIGHDARIGDGCTLSGHCDVTGNVVLEEGVFLGSHASIVPGKRVRAHASISAGSVVVRNAPAHSVMAGVPAKCLFRRDVKEAA